MSPAPGSSALVARALRTPTCRVRSPCWARAASGHAAAPPRAIGQALWLKELETYKEFPPLQDPASYNLDQVREELKKAPMNPSQ
jgi:hypothetical protein